MFAETLSPPAAEAIRRKAAEVVARPEYELTSGVSDESLHLWARVFRWILTPFRWLMEALSGLPTPIRWLVVVVLTAAAIALIIHIVYSFVTAIRGPSARLKYSSQRTTRRRPEDLETEADVRAADGDQIGAIRCLFKAALLRIERAEDKPFRRGITNREILRRYRSSALFEPLGHFVEVIDTRWYGHELCVEGDYLNCRSDHAKIRSLMERRTDAIRS